MKTLLLFTALVVFFSRPSLNAQDVSKMEAKSSLVIADNTSDKLIVLWTSDDPMVAERVALMYTHAAKKAGWFKEVILIVWGPSAKLISTDTRLQDKLKDMQKDGVVIEACIACANAYGVIEGLKKLGYDVKGMGKPLTDYLKSGAKVLTF